MKYCKVKLKDKKLQKKFGKIVEEEMNDMFKNIDDGEWVKHWRFIGMDLADSDELSLSE